MKKISPSTRLKEIITDYQLDQIFRATASASWTSFSTRLESISAAKALSKTSFLIFSKAGSRSFTALKTAATPSLKSKKNLDS